MICYQVKVFTDRNLNSPLEVRSCKSINQALYCFADVCDRVREAYKVCGFYVYLYDMQMERDIIRYYLSKDDYEELISCCNQH